MNETEAVVARVDGQSAWLEICRPADCEQCGSTAGCGLGGRDKRLRRVDNRVGARVGDHVVLSVADGAVLRASAYSYLMPLLVGLLGAGLGEALAGDAAALIGLVAGLLLGIAALHMIGRRLARGAEPMLTMRVKAAVVQLHRNGEI